MQPRRTNTPVAFSSTPFRILDLTIDYKKVLQNEHDALCQAYIDLEKSLENARTNS
ncbi:MAG: hypothetical protein NXY57DRAFT_969241 [Lentinula lateritia]|nr:MAG: hypothetical protein NXY57DRAFT_969241 [Lentinula lateritia]